MVAIPRNFETVQVEKLVLNKSGKTGAMVESWEPLDTIQISINKIKTTKNIDKVRKEIISYKGLTKSKILVPNITRIVNKDGYIYSVDDVIQSLWTNVEMSRSDVF